MDQKVRKIREERWQELISEAISSGMTKREWCRLHGIRTRQFFYWQNKLRKKALLTQETKQDAVPTKTYSPENEEPGFLELTPPDETPTAGMTTLAAHSGPERIPMESLKPELLLAYGGFQVLVGHEVEEDVLRKVIRVIKNA